MIALLPLREKVAEGRMRGRDGLRLPLIRPFGAPSPARGRRMIALLPSREKVAEGRMRGRDAGFSSKQLRLARGRIGVRTTREGCGPSSHYTWILET